jgi:RNA polymerase sigma-70 factor (ECF subfamily)
MTAYLRTRKSWPPDATAPGRPLRDDKAERFRALALPHLDDVYTLARYLLRDPSAAEDATQECYLRAFRHFDSFRGEAIKPWLLAILRNVCRAEFARRARTAAVEINTEEDAVETVSVDPATSPEAAMLSRLDADTAQKLIAALPTQFRDVLVLREINDLSYREIAEAVGAPVGTVMSRLARGRSLLRAAWTAEEKN